MHHHPQFLMASLTRRHLLRGTLGSVAGLAAWQWGWQRHATVAAQPHIPRGQMTWAFHFSLVPTFFDPAETQSAAAFVVLYALHDALVKPRPDNSMAPSLATAWQESPDGLTYDFQLRHGVTFHNGDPFTAEDVQYSFARYKGTGAAELKHKVKAVEVVSPHHVRFQLNAPWPDFLTFYATPATGAAWIVPKHYTEKIGSATFKEAPIGLGPYRLVRYQPGVEVVLEANPTYWRQVPHVQRLVLKSVPERTTRVAVLTTREADVATGLGGMGEAVRSDPRLQLVSVPLPNTWWLVFTSQQYDPQSPWSDRRVRLAVNHAINRQAINDTLLLGYGVPTGNIIPRKIDGALELEPYPYDPQHARQLLAEAGYANGFDAGECPVQQQLTGVGEALVNDLRAVGIRTTLRPVDAAAHQAAHREKKYQHVAMQASGAYGTAATRIEAFVQSTGAESWIKDPDIDAWYAQQATERDRQKRHALLHRIQQKLYEEVRFLPIMDAPILSASGPRVAVSGLGLTPLFPYSAPYEDVQLKP
jgi:peptide/nickel transport system substrate-binding protein